MKKLNARKRSNQTLLTLVDQLSPAMCRIYAHVGRRLMSHMEISNRSGLSLSRVSELSRKMSWAGIPIDTIVAFSVACGVNHLNARRVRQHLKQGSMSHLRNLEGNQKRMVARIYTEAYSKS